MALRLIVKMKLDFAVTSWLATAASWTAAALGAAWLQCVFVQAGGAASLPVAAAGQSFLVDVWQTEEGLPKSSVSSIAQTRDGYLWVGTLNGLVRFDGLRMTTCRLRELVGPRGDRIASLWCRGSGELWVSTAGGGLARLAEGKFSAVAATKEGGPFDGWHRIVAEDLEGGLWTAVADQALIRRSPEGDAAVFTGRLPSWQFQPWITTDAEGHVVCVTSEDVRVWKGLDAVSLPAASELGQVKPLALARRREGGLWVLTKAELRGWHASGWLESWANPIVAEVTHVLETRDGAVWVATFGEGLFRFTAGGKAQQISEHEGLPGPRVRCLFEDREGNLWAGLDDAGLARLRPRLFEVWGRADGLRDPGVLSVCEARDGGLWIGTYAGGLHRLDEPRVEAVGAALGLSAMRIWSVLEDSRGAVWVGGFDGTVQRRLTGAFAPVALPDSSLYGVLAIYEDRRGDIWLGRAGDPPLVRARGGDPMMLDPISGWTNAWVVAFAEDPTNGLWVGGRWGGLARWRDGHLEHFGSAQGLPTDQVMSLFTDRRGTLWVGTFGSGLCRWDGAQFRTVRQRDGLWDDIILGINQDDNGRLWMTSPRGPFHVQLSELDDFLARKTKHVTSVPYTRADGLPSQECTGGYSPSLTRTRDGRLWISTVRGLAGVDPRKLHPDLPPPGLIIEGVTADDREITPQPVYRIPPGTRCVEVRYVGLSLTSPEKVRYMTWLVGTEDDWQDVGTERRVSYRLLPPGRYEFRVRTAVGTGGWSQPAVAVLQVAPYWWQTWWCRAGAFLASGAAVFAVVSARARRKYERELARMALREAVERERSRIARDLHDELGSNLSHIGFLAAVACDSTDSVEVLRKDLARINDQARESVQCLDEIVWVVNPGHDLLPHFATYLCQYSQQAAAAARIPCRLEVPSELPPHPMSAELRHHLFLIAKEALHNAFQHAKANEVWLRLTWCDETLGLVIEDRGKGFDPNQLGTAGDGLTNMRRRAEELRAEFELFSQPGQGTRVRVAIRLTEQSSHGALPRMGDAPPGAVA
jgi:signal transduction histidine kinase/ligand-binding sensor domain-containing protein